MSLQEKLAKKYEDLAEVKPKIEAGDPEAMKHGEAITGEIESLRKSIDLAEKANELLASAGKKEDPDSTETIKAAKSLGEHFVMNMPETHEKHFRINVPEFKAYSDPMEVGTVSSVAVPRALVTDIDKNIVPEVIANTYLRQLFGAETISGNALTFYTEGALEASSTYGFEEVAEGGTKPQISFADPTEHTVSLSKIAAYIKETDEYIDDAPFLASAINGRLLNYLGLKEEDFLLSSLEGTSGIQTDTTSWADADMADAQAIAELIFAKMMAVQTSSGFAADAIIVNPAVWQTLRLGKDANNQYFGGGYFSDGQSKTLWGVPLYTSTFIDAPVSASATGEIWVGSFKACGSVVSKGGVSVEATNTDQDDFIKNLMTIRAEERLALAVRRPGGFCKITKSAS